MTDLPETTKPSEAENVSGSQLSLVTLRSFIRALHLAQLQAMGDKEQENSEMKN